ncbi:MBL fold metallo-hydrolase [Microbulbifer rhizosphaerae]|uniref:N-acyl-phosphatidylethanolamine-hydrolyzing phospholipase D n=1 Tax=Microbulbifer rhizosphaerae TaxID=1562603 RepID=A0A7W4WDY2_9GAMM|nr:MBL fold metallo-hydrolase [Microbulbifer rhizosphaerae]MBB3061942.1 N-acyl-phosphatidylethanolamine-hydrolyzing phospholipase D [Microbulbifer rhizosphaerae]
MDFLRRGRLRGLRGEVARPRRPDHHTGTGFRNSYGAANSHQGLWAYLRMRLSEGALPEACSDGAAPDIASDRDGLARPSSDFQVTWLGHASTLLQLGGINVLTDPVFAERASFLRWMGPRRRRSAPVGLDELPPIDYVVISHNHYDHLDAEVVARLGNRVHWLVPLGLKRWFAVKGVSRVTELDWWQSESRKGIRFTAAPAKHWSRRGLWDTNRTLWASWVIESGGKTLWFAGDTGYSREMMCDIRHRFGAFDLALLPIGAYGPRWYMKEKHADPFDAVEMHRDLDAAKSVAIHWGTFVLTHEPPDEPPRLLARARERGGVAPDEFHLLAIGETLPIAKSVQRTRSGPRPAVPGASSRCKLARLKTDRVDISTNERDLNANQAD